MYLVWHRQRGQPDPPGGADLTWCYQVCKDLGAQQPLPSATAPTSQTKSKEGFEGYLDKCVAIAERAGKELIANETVWGARDDATHVEVIRYALAQLTQRGIGFTVHALHHSLVADLHRDEWGPVGWPEWLHFIEADGSLRPGHEAFNEFGPQ